MGMGEVVMLSPSHPLQLVLGPGCWLAWFAAIYAGLSLACAAAPPAPELGPATLINLMLWLSTLALMLLLSYWARRCWQWARQNPGASSAEKMVARVGSGLHAVATFSTLAVGVMVLLLPPCL